MGFAEVDAMSLQGPILTELSTRQWMESFAETCWNEVVKAGTRSPPKLCWSYACYKLSYVEVMLS